MNASPRFVLVTGSPEKRREAERIVGRPLEVEALDLPELQSLDLQTVLEAKAREAWRRLRRPLVVEETALELVAFGGFPGPLVKWMLEAMGAAGVARAALALGDSRAVARCALRFQDGDEAVVAEGVTAGTLVLPPAGDAGFGWDPVLVPEGESRTVAELGEAEKDRIGQRGRAWRALLAKLDAGA